MIRIALFVILLFVSVQAPAEEPVAIGSRRELFVDDALVDRLAGRAELQLHQPTAQNIALVTDEPWEGLLLFCTLIFSDHEYLSGRYDMG